MSQCIKSKLSSIILYKYKLLNLTEENICNQNLFPLIFYSDKNIWSSIGALHKLRNAVRGEGFFIFVMKRQREGGGLRELLRNAKVYVC